MTKDYHVRAEHVASKVGQMLGRTLDTEPLVAQREHPHDVPGIGLSSPFRFKISFKKTLVTGASGEIGSLLIGAYHAHGKCLIPLDEKSTETAHGNPSSCLKVS